MNAEILNIEICNPTNEKLVADLFNLDSIGEGTPVSDGSGLLYTVAGGAGNGSQLPTDNVTGGFLDTVNNIYYATTSLGLWIYNIDTDAGSIIDSSTIVNGDAMPAGGVSNIDMDMSSNTLMMEATNGFWIYNINTNTGKRYTPASGVTSGTNVPGDINSLEFDSSNNYIWVAGINFLWRLDLSTNNGLNVTVVASGVDFSGNGQSIYYHSLTDLVFVGTLSTGLYRYNIDTDNGHFFTTSGGAANGSQIPSNIIGKGISSNVNTIYIPTASGVWVYNIATDTGSIIDTSTVVNGDFLNNNNTRTCFYAGNNKLYVGTTDSVWSYDKATDTGENIGSTSGDARPASGFSLYVSYNEGELFESVNGAGVWRFNEFVRNPIIIQSNESGDVSYDYITRDVQQSPIEITKIILTTENLLQKYNSLSHVLNTVLGKKTSYSIQFSDYVNPLLPFRQIHVELKKPFVIDFENFLQLPIEANICVQLLFEYQQISPGRLMKHLSPEKDDVLPIYYPELGITGANAGFDSEIDNKNGIVSEIEKPEMNWFGPWIVLGIVSMLLRFKQHS